MILRKMTPNLGQGGNCAIESAAALANQLHKLVNEHQNYRPTTDELSTYLRAYQKSHQDRINVINFVSGIVTRLQARDGFMHKLMSKYVYKVVDDNGFNLNSDMLVAAAKIDYLPLPERSIGGWMPFDGNLGVTKKPNQARRMLVASPFLVLFGVAVSVIWTAEYFNGTREFLRQDYGNGGVSAAKDSYLGVPWADALLKQLVDRSSSHVFRLMNMQKLQLISNMGELIPIHTIWTIEAWRSGNFRIYTNLSVTLSPQALTLNRENKVLTSIKSSMLFALAYQWLGFGVVAPIYCFFHYVHTSYHNYASIDQRVVQPKYAVAILPAILVSMILPTILMFINFDSGTYQLLITIWQFFPLWFTILHRAFAMTIVNHTKRTDPGTDLPILQMIYVFVGLVSAAIHLYVRSFVLSGHGAFFAGIQDPFATVSSAIEGISRSASYSYLLGFGSSLLWVAMTLHNLKKAGRTDAGWVKIVSLLVVGTIVVGPGAVVAAFWMWREDILSRRRTGRESVPVVN